MKTKLPPTWTLQDLDDEKIWVAGLGDQVNGGPILWGGSGGKVSS